MGTERFDEKCKILKKKEGKTTAEKIEYTELNMLVKKKKGRGNAGKEKRNRKNIVNGRGPREAYKGEARKKISCMIKENGESTTDRDEVKTINNLSNILQETL
ncbi:hypothetical protein PoB_003283700 [Plakobranchus ocellatus]|uniref:Uncharacterized protein n=1 Tax=Plakobranchus ocellatus TaxID=259542 RepID=A0AAV4AH27_9GAST|nr:hypothetical protein PoB_003283700 [Plakobranchus ocellatus]